MGAYCRPVAFPLLGLRGSGSCRFAGVPDTVCSCVVMPLWRAVVCVCVWVPVPSPVSSARTVPAFGFSKSPKLPDAHPRSGVRWRCLPCRGLSLCWFSAALSWRWHARRGGVSHGDVTPAALPACAFSNSGVLGLASTAHCSVFCFFFLSPFFGVGVWPLCLPGRPIAAFEVPYALWLYPCPCPVCRVTMWPTRSRDGTRRCTRFVLHAPFPPPPPP
jgi:hypothetical protein